uniref:Anaphase-promoting complex subunit 6 n=1 Tax=Chenopodium quinoa TaxID=63459 RepID=A0A803LVT7_CHEQI
MREEEIEKLRGVVRDCVSKHLYSSAIFFADKVAAFTSDPADIYMQAQALFLGRHFRRAFHLLNASHEELKEWDQCLQMLGDAKLDEHGNVSDTKDRSVMYLDKDAQDHEINISAAICFLRGRAYEALENRAQARQWYIAAVKADPLCYEQDKENVVEAMFDDVEKENACSPSSDSSFNGTLKNNTDLLACKAEYYHQCGEYQKCFELTSLLLEKDPFHLKCTLVHLAAAMELGQSNELYIMACNLVKDHPQNKATSLEGTFLSSWIGQGNAYAALEEGDQAMLAYRTAARLFPGCHLPTLYIGMEYMRTHSFKLAEQAQTICSSDPLVYNELGVVAYHMKEYKKAVRWFEKTLANIPASMNATWEPTIVNLAHAYRKLKIYPEAIKYYEKALNLSTKSLSTYSGLAYTYHLKGDYSAAITHYHKALWLKPDDQFCTEMLTLALAEESRCDPDSIPGLIS